MSAIHPDIAAVLDGSAQWALVEGDCLDVLPTLPERSVTHVITDPPYSEYVHTKALSRAVDFGFDHITQEQREALADECARLASRWTLAFCDVESSHLWSGAFTSAGLDYCRTGAWVKIGAMPQFTGDRPGAGFEAIVIVHPKGRKRWNGGGSQAVWTHLIDRGMPGQDPRCHPTQKPLSLMLELVELFTDPGDVILDPYAGSGTTGVACLRLGRRFIGIERKPEHAKTARERLEAESAGLTLKAKRAGQVSLFGGGA